MFIDTTGPAVLEPNLISNGHIKLYGGEVRVKFSPEDHRYLVSDDRVDCAAWHAVPSVTTVLSKVIDRSKFLCPWAGRMSMEMFLKRVEEGRAYSRAELDAIGFAVKDAHKLVLDDASRIGHDVHEWLQKFILARVRGTGFPSPPTDPQVRACCSAGRCWIVENDVKPLAVEQVLYSRAYRVIGTMDLVGILVVDGQVAVADYKSSNRLHKSYGLQLAAYRAMLLEQQGVEALDRWLIHLSKTDGTFHPERLSRDTADTEAEAFFKMVEAYRALHDLEFFEE